MYKALKCNKVIFFLQFSFVLAGDGLPAISYIPEIFKILTVPLSVCISCACFIEYIWQIVFLKLFYISLAAPIITEMMEILRYQKCYINLILLNRLWRSIVMIDLLSFQISFLYHVQGTNIYIYVWIFTYKYKHLLLTYFNYYR